MSLLAKNNSPCLLCGYPKLDPCYCDAQTRSVTSDCKIWEEPPSVFVCPRCSHLQKLTNQDSARRTQAVYAGYEIYGLSEGEEQLIFQNGSEAPVSRSAKIIERLASLIPFKREGVLLDIGCGNGAFLSAFGTRHPGWSLFGFEQNTRYRERVLSLPQVKDFYSDSFENIQEKFDLISLIHVFEHIAEPGKMLQWVRPLLSEEGYLLIQVPNILKNPFDMVVIDHYSHFSPEVLSHFVADSGFETVCLATDWVHKEISLLCRRGEVHSHSSWYASLPTLDLIQNHQAIGAWMNAIIEGARQKTTPSNFGIFGTAIAGTWMAGNLGDRVHFFVDEDKSRTGKFHLGKPVLSPQALKFNDLVFIAFPHDIALRILERMKKLSPAVFKIPPPLKKILGATSAPSLMFS